MSCDFSSASELGTEALNFFSNRGEDYERYRPVHPDNAIAALLSGLKPADQLIAADVGAGTGIGARLLADRGARVWAIEPNADMRAAATPHEGVQFLAGTAESIPLETASVDLVTVFQAFHWFDFMKSLHEFQRILKPGGRLALVWSFWDQQDAISRRYTRLIAAASKPRERHYAQTSTVWQRLRYQLFWQGIWLPYFHNLQQRSFTFNQALDLAGLIGLARSQGFMPASGAALRQLNADLAAFHHEFRDEQGLVQLAYRTRLYIATSRQKLVDAIDGGF